MHPHLEPHQSTILPCLTRGCQVLPPLNRSRHHSRLLTLLLKHIYHSSHIKHCCHPKNHSSSSRILNSLLINTSSPRPLHQQIQVTYFFPPTPPLYPNKQLQTCPKKSPPAAGPRHITSNPNPTHSILSPPPNTTSSFLTIQHNSPPPYIPTSHPIPSSFTPTTCPPL
jgi:hypothetical protein